MDGLLWPLNAQKKTKKTSPSAHCLDDNKETPHTRHTHHLHSLSKTQWSHASIISNTQISPVRCREGAACINGTVQTRNCTADQNEHGDLLRLPRSLRFHDRLEKGGGVQTKSMVNYSQDLAAFHFAACFIHHMAGDMPCTPEQPRWSQRGFLQGIRQS